MILAYAFVCQQEVTCWSHRVDGRWRCWCWLSLHLHSGGSRGFALDSVWLERIRWSSSASHPFPFSGSQHTSSGILSRQWQRNKKSVGITKASQGLCFSRFRSWHAVASTLFCWPKQVTCSSSTSRRREEAQLITGDMTKGMNRRKVKKKKKNWGH